MRDVGELVSIIRAMSPEEMRANLAHTAVEFGIIVPSRPGSTFLLVEWEDGSITDELNNLGSGLVHRYDQYGMTINTRVEFSSVGSYVPGTPIPVIAGHVIGVIPCPSSDVTKAKFKVNWTEGAWKGQTSNHLREELIVRKSPQ